MRDARPRSPARSCGGFPATTLALTAALGVGGAAWLQGQTAEELQAAARRLGQVQATLEPLPETGITRDVGQIAIMEHDGTNYDARLEDGTLNYEARTRVGQRFFETHGDDYDFLVVFTNFDFETSDATAFHLLGRNHVSGIGKPIGSAGEGVFGSPARLQGWIDMAVVSRYRERPFSLSPGELGFLETLNVLAHEVGHQWLAEARYLDGGVESEALLGRDGSHWSYLLDSDASLMYGADWRDDGDGRFTAARVRGRYSALDLYLMGFLPAEEVGPLTLLQNPAVDPERINQEGETVSGTPTTVVMKQLTDAMGERQPDHRHSQKEFRLGFIFLTAPGTEPSPEDLAAVERVRQAFGPHFFALTRGVAWADTSLAVLPPAPRAASPDLERALAWLLAQQALDGSWADATGTSLRDTAAVVRALARAGARGPAWQHGLLWLQQAQSESIDFAARRDAALAGFESVGADSAARAMALLSRQNPDGGLGAGRDFASDALDTALVLRALRALDHPGDARVQAAVAALRSLQNADGGWSAIPTGQTSTVVTAEVLLGLLDWPDVPGASDLQGSGMDALLARRNPDGGFGASPSTPFASALALEVLLRAGGQTELIEPLVAWLQQHQRADGSWSGSPFQTALVLGALNESLRPNLTVPADSLVLAPSPAREGDIVQVSAVVRNGGRAGAPASVARLFDGDPGSSPAVAEVAVPPLAPGQEAPISFDFPTLDRPGPRTLFVVADAGNQVPESREDDNATSRDLTVVGLLADLAVTPADIAVVPAAPEVGENATISVTVTNLGERVSDESRLRLTLTHPSDGTTPLPDASIPPLGPGEGAVVSVSWTPESPGEHLLRATADAAYEVPESDETNGVAERTVEVLTAAPDGVELTVRHLSLSPDTLYELPQAVEARVLVENVGRSPGGTTVALFDDDTGDRLNSLALELAAREAELVSLPVTIRTPGVHRLTAVVDPDDLTPENEEGDNSRGALLPVEETFDVEVASAVLSSVDVELGETVGVTVEVANRGTLDLPNVPVQLAHDSSDGPVELARATLTLGAGETRTVTLSWTACLLGDDLPLLVRADPFDLLSERHEDNNQVALVLRVSTPDRPNLTVSGDGVTIEPDPPVEGGTATLSATVRNAGGAPSGPFSVRFVVGDPDEGGLAIGEVGLAELAAGAEETVQLTWAPVDSRGSLGLFVVVDPDQEVDEADESDNVAFRPFQAVGLPNLVLTAGDVSLDPAYPREGEPVTIRATARNLGGQPSPPTSLEVTEGEPTGTVVSRPAIPPLAPGAFETLTLSWTPEGPAGARALRLSLDDGNLVEEQDEGDNTARLVVVVQNGDLYLTAPYFSPDGDGVLDETSLAWRATGSASVVVSDSGGQVVRSLLTEGPPSGSTTWDGRDEHGILVWDGRYTLTLSGDGDRELARASVVLDTNRSPIHEATGPVDTVARNLTCSLPSSVVPQAWSASEDALFAIVPAPAEGFPVGLLRIGLAGDWSYVAQDPWYAGASFAGSVAASPDGRSLLMKAGPQTVVDVDLLTGERKVVGSGYGPVAWSPDARFIVIADQVVARDGTLVGDLDGLGWNAGWAWAPSSDRLAQGGTVVTRDGQVVFEIPVGDDPDEFQPSWTVWRGDGRIVTGSYTCYGGHVASSAGPRNSCWDWFVIDPDTRVVEKLDWSTADEPAWSPDGTRALVGQEIRGEDGTLVGSLPAEISVSPRSSAGLFSSWPGSGLPGAVCGGKYSDVFALSTVANLTVDLEAARLPGNAGIVLRGTAADRYLERSELDYARTNAPETWYPIGAAFDAPIVGQTFTVWVPPGPGTYVVRLRARDRAGHARVRTRTVAWDRVPVLTNFTQSGYYISPDGNGVKDEVEFRYLVAEPTRLDVRVVGPEPGSGGAPAAGVVRRLAFEYSEIGPRSFAWDGTDDANRVVPDGRYTVFLNELPFRVEVDDTPPEVGLRFENLHVASARISTRLTLGGCRPGGRTRRRASSLAGSAVDVDRLWHVVDPHLESWTFLPAPVPQAHSEQVFVPETDASGAPVLDDGRPRVARANGRPVDRREAVWSDPRDLGLEAVDRAGNVSRIAAIQPDEEAIFPLMAVARCEVLAEQLVTSAPGARDPVNELRPEGVFMQVGSALQLEPEERDLRLEYQPVEGGAWRELPFPNEGEAHATLEIASFEGLGVDPTGTYRGRFLGQGASGEVSSEFVFCPCAQWLRAEIRGDVFHGQGFLALRAHLDQPLLWAHASLTLAPLGEPAFPLGALDLAPMTEEEARYWDLPWIPEGEVLFGAPMPPVDVDCTRPLEISVQVLDAAGERYPSPEVEAACQKLHLEMPAGCEYTLAFTQSFPGCGGSPDTISVMARGGASNPARVTVEAGPPEAPTLQDVFDFVPTPEVGAFEKTYELSVAGHPDGTYPFRGRVEPLDPLLGEGMDTSFLAIVDRTAPVGEFLLPPEGGAACVTPGTGAPHLQTLARIDDVSPWVVSQASWRSEGGSWHPLRRVCLDLECEKDPTVPTGVPFELAWDATWLDSGWQEVRLEYCDRAGNTGETLRHLFVTRQQPQLRVTSQTPQVFSPNGDGRAEETTAVVRLAQAARVSARIHTGSAEGAVVRTLYEDQSFTATDIAAVWDGRSDAGTVVPDGPYVIVFSAADACGGAAEAIATVEVDTAPPDVAVTEPTGGQRVSAGVDVLGHAMDPHLAGWDLDVSCEGSGEWVPIASGSFLVPAEAFLTRWDTSQSPPGECQLRLVAEDDAANRSPAAFATALVERGDLIERLAATPDVFSPNGDGRRDTASLDYTLARQARVRLEVRVGGETVRVLEADALREAGPVSQVWDGLDATGVSVPDGDYVLWMRAEDPVVATVYEEETTRLEIDTLPPVVSVARPVPEGFVSATETVVGSVEDENLVEYVVTAAPLGATPVELGRETRERREDDLAPLGSLAEGHHTLRVWASDLGGNETQVEVPFQVDSTPPETALQSPLDGAVIARGEEPVAITGLVEDDHLAGWTLQFGLAGDAVSLTPLAQGTTGGSALSLATWDVRFVPDGRYALSLSATDLGGLSAESRIHVTLDGSPPGVEIQVPGDGDYVTNPTFIQGSVADAHLASWTLSVAPGEPPTAWQWSRLGSGSSPVEEGTLAEWSPLPADGVYTLRLEAEDEVGQTATSDVTVTVDTTPPATPTGLEARVLPAERTGFGLVVVSWDPNAEPDLAGYRISADRSETTDELLGEPRWNDGERVEGTYLYTVVAEDEAGNTSPPAHVEVLVDLMPPTLAFLSPSAGAEVSGLVEVTGTAWSADDFAEYRLLVGDGEAPTTWTLLQRSTLPVAGGRLGDWLALADGPHVLALEAEDTRGNEGRITRAVQVDTQPPEAPVLLRVDHVPPPVDRLVPVWQPSPSEDVDGYLVYRNGGVANAASLVLGDPRGFLVPGPSFEDDALPDGEHCYTIVAMDGAGNTSVPSEEVCASLDNRAPKARIVQPADGARFGQPLRVLAESPDLDVASVLFERREAGVPDWVPFGERHAAPWEVTLDPEGLVLGGHELRAVATDETGHTDPDPAFITVVYGDTTSPEPPADPVARVDGADVTLTWTPSPAPDLAGYRVYRGGERVGADLTETSFVDAGLETETYAYTVTAVDADDNESPPSAPASAVVYALGLDTPPWPVVGTALATVTGEGSRPGTTVKVEAGASTVAEAAATAESFQVDAVPLAPEGNMLRARGEDGAGNRSLPSNEIVLIANAPPAPVPSLEAEVDADAVSLTWPPVTDADLFGYVVRRDGKRLTASVREEEALSFEASVSPATAARVFDQDPSTLWPNAAAAGEWRVVLPAAVLVERIHLRFGPPDYRGLGPPARYRVLARWQGRDLPILEVHDNGALIADHPLALPFATDSLLVVLETPGQLAEVEVHGLDATPPGTESFLDAAVPDGEHTYTVAAIDRYGAEGPAATAEAAVGDVEAPSAPTGLEATPEGRDVLLTWDKSPEPDVESYVVVRDGSRIGTSPAPAYRDEDLPNGTYVYAVIAVDTAGHESPESAPAEATIDVAPVPPAAPVILEPTDAAHPIDLDQTAFTDVAGSADPGTLVSLDVNGEPRGAARAQPGFILAGEAELDWPYEIALSPDGRYAAWADADQVALQDLTTGDVRSLAHGGDNGAYALRYSPDGRSLALARDSGPWYESVTEVVRLDVTDGSVQVLAEGYAVDLAWSPDGTRLAVTFEEDFGTSVHILDVETAESTELHRSQGLDQHLRWSPDGTRLAFLRKWSSTLPSELWIADLTSGRTTRLDERVWSDSPPSWSSDGRLLAWTREDAFRRIRVRDTTTGEDTTPLATSGVDFQDPRFSPSGDWLSFVRVTHLQYGWKPTDLAAWHRTSGLVVSVGEIGGSLQAHEWIESHLSVVSYGQLSRYATLAGRFDLSSVPLVPGENQLVARATDPASGLSSDDSETVTVTVPEAIFPNLTVTADGVWTLPSAPVLGRPVELRVRVDNVGAIEAWDVDVGVRVLDPDGRLVVDTVAVLDVVEMGSAAEVSVPWTPEQSGSHTVQVIVDPDSLVPELREDDNAAERTVLVAADDGLVAAIDSDRSSYGPGETAVVSVSLANAGPAVAGVARTVVEDGAGAEVAVLDERPVDLEYAQGDAWTLTWPTKATWAGSYRFRVGVRAEGDAADRAAATHPFVVEATPQLALLVRPEPALAPAGAPVSFALAVENTSPNTPLEEATLRLTVQPEGAPGPAVFETVRALPSLVPGATWQAADVWPSAQPAGHHAVTLAVETTGGEVLAVASAILTVEPGVPVLLGTLEVAPAHVMRGDTAEAQVALTNEGTLGVASYPVSVDVVSGPEATVRASATATVDVAAGQRRELTLPLETGGLSPDSFVVLLRAGVPPSSLARDRLTVHGPIAPPSPHDPPDGGTVDTAHPTLTVNNASSADAAARTYEFQLFGDATLRQALPGASDVAETPQRTSWRVTAALAEDAKYWWRARARDGFSTSPWSDVASFTVDAENRPPTAPVPDTPSPGSQVASLQPVLTVRNAADPEGDALVYDFRLALGPDMDDVVTSATDVTEGLGLTSWTVPVALEEDALYSWSARARDAAGASPWTVPVSFVPDALNAPPTAPVPLSPVDGVEVDTLTPELVVGNASDPDGDPRVYRFGIDTEPTFDSPQLQVSPEITEGAEQTTWIPLEPLVENTTWFWRAFASDGRSETPSVVASFFVNVANDPPGTPVLLEPVDGQVVGDATPTLRLRNTTDPEDDPLHYAFAVHDASGDVVTQSSPVPSGEEETSWTVPDPLAEDADFTWTAQASDGDRAGPWSAPAAFRVDAVREPPTAPVPILPTDGAIVDETRPTLVVQNATNPEGLALVYTFELYGVSGGVATLLDEAHDVSEEPDTTAWTPSVDLSDGPYEWRARASDPVQDGPWSATSRFEVLLDPPPAAPTGLQAIPGDARVHLDWIESPENDVNGYRVYRATASGGPYDPVGATAWPAFDDEDLTNGVVYHYVVTATDTRQESQPSQEASARPEAPAVLVAEVGYEPSSLSAECLLARGAGHRAELRGDGSAALQPSGPFDEETAARLRSEPDLIQWFGGAQKRPREGRPQCHWPPDPGPDCPEWIHATVELPPGHAPGSIDVSSLRLLGVAAAEPQYQEVVDTDGDGLTELRVRFRLNDLAPLLKVGVNPVAVTGHAGTSAVSGTSLITVSPLEADLRISPRTLNRRSKGNDILAVVTFASGVPADEADTCSIRLNDAVPVKRVLSSSGRDLLLKFDRSAVLGVLPTGSSVEVRVSGTLHGLWFEGVDRIKVKD